MVKETGNETQGLSFDSPLLQFFVLFRTKMTPLFYLIFELQYKSYIPSGFGLPSELMQFHVLFIT